MSVLAVSSAVIPSAQPVQPPSPKTQAGSDFKLLAAALQSGDLAGAQKALAALQGDTQAVRGHRGHHHHHQAQAPQPQRAASAGSVVNILA